MEGFKQSEDPAIGTDHSGSEPVHAHQPVQPGCVEAGLAGLGCVDPQKTVDLHQPVPESPQREHDFHAVSQVGEEQGDRDAQQDDRSHGQSDTEPAKQRPVSVGAEHSRKVMAVGSQGSDDRVDRLVGELLPREEDKWQDQQRRCYEQDQVGHRTKNPGCSTWRRCSDRRRRRCFAQRSPPIDGRR